MFPNSIGFSEEAEQKLVDKIFIYIELIINWLCTEGF